EASKLDVSGPNELEKENLLTSYQAVCLLNMSRPDEQLWQKLHEYVQKGGGLAIIPGKKSDPAAYNGSKGRELLPGTLGNIVAADDERGIPWETASYNHPVIAPFKKWSGLGNVDFFKFPPRALRYWAVEPAASGSIIVRYADKEKRPALLERHF